jgi:uncharacterized protein (DUF305 family)
MRSVILHHSGAVLKCELSQISDPELKNLCAQIIKSQSEAINLMISIMQRL